MSSKDFSQALPKGSVLKGGKYEYTVEAVLGKGGFGFTYLVSAVLKVDNIEMKMFFAVKEHFVSTLSSRGDNSRSVESSQPVRVQVEGSLKDFRSEARRLQELSGSSRNIVSVNETFDDNGTAYYVMEYIDGQGLNEVINESGPMDEKRALELIRPIIEAVKVVHDARMTHSDIKPGNILLEIDKTTGVLRPVLIDFGLAKHYDKEGNATSTLNTVGYSEGYSPIEQYGGLKTFSPTADVYALGATLFTMLTGTRPPSASNVDPEELDAEMLSHGVSDNTRLVVMRAMEYKSDQRYPTVAAMADALIKDAVIKRKTDSLSEKTEILDNNKNKNQEEIKIKDGGGAKPPVVKKPKEPKDPNQPGKSNFNWKKLSLIVLAGVVVGLVCFFIFKKSNDSSNYIPDPEYKGYGDYEYDNVDSYNDKYEDFYYDSIRAAEMLYNGYEEDYYPEEELVPAEEYWDEYAVDVDSAVAVEDYYY